MATEPVEDIPDEKPEDVEELPDEEEEEEVIVDTPQGGVAVPADEADPNSSIEEKQAAKQQAITDGIQHVRDLLRSTGPSREADLAIMKLDEAESWAGKSVTA
jgi:hypothetical protein